MDFTHSYRDVLPRRVVERYEFRETRKAAAVLKATNPEEFADIADVLANFKLTEDDIRRPGGNKSETAARLDEAFRVHGWREGQYRTRVDAVLKLLPYKAAGESGRDERETTVLSEGYRVDNVKGGRVLVDVEWNAKDGNLDRDISVYRSFYDAGVIDGGVIITKVHAQLRGLAREMGVDKFKTTTTTNLENISERLARGDGGGCPILAVGITARCMTP